MRVTIPYTYTKSFTPPRCRKPRAIQDAATISLSIREVSGAEAPIAITIFHSAYPEQGTTYRWWGNKLWVLDSFSRACGQPHETQTLEQMKADPWGLHQNYLNTHYGKQENRVKLMAQARRYVLIDGFRYRVAGEPRFVINTFGLGHNHGGTGLFIENHYNSNISRERYYRIDQRTEALAEATRVATGRGDDQSIPFNIEEVTILVPEAVQLNPRKEHGAGDPFMNRVEKAITTSGDPVTAGLGVLCVLAGELSGK